jgi:aryl-alcohol dehydrogenase-like predicted oxidoreductase
MQTRSLGFSDVVVSEITLGTWGLATGAYGPVEPSRFEAVVCEAFDRGITTFDVAPLWGDGEGERRVRAGLGERVKDAVFIGRAGLSSVDGAPVARFEGEALVADVEGSLGRLGRDCLDVLLLHNPPLKAMQSELWQRSMEDLLETGKIRAWGVACGNADEARFALKIGAQAVGLVHHLLAPDLLHELAPSIKEAGAGMIGRSPLLHGLLAGRWDAQTEFAFDDHRSRRWDRSGMAVRLEQVERVRFLVEGEVPDLATAALRYALSSPFVSTVCVGARTVEQAAAAAAASRPAPLLPDRALARLLGK